MIMVNCYCLPIGTCFNNNFAISLASFIYNDTDNGYHHHHYFFTVEITNQAQLMHTNGIIILVIDSAATISMGFIVGTVLGCVLFGAMVMGISIVSVMYRQRKLHSR